MGAAGCPERFVPAVGRSLGRGGGKTAGPGFAGHKPVCTRGAGMEAEGDGEGPDSGSQGCAAHQGPEGEPAYLLAEGPANPGCPRQPSAGRHRRDW